MFEVALTVLFLLIGLDVWLMVRDENRIDKESKRTGVFPRYIKLREIEERHQAELDRRYAAENAKNANRTDWGPRK